MHARPARPPRRAGYPPSVYAAPVPADLTHAPPASLWRWTSVPAAAGLPAGLLWWLLAPGGALYGSGRDPQTWLPRDFVFGLIGFVAGLVVGWLVARQRHRPGAAAKVACAVIGSVIGSLIAWQFGLWLGDMFTHLSGEPASPHMQFSLLGLGALAIWPAAAALLCFIIIVGSMLRRKPRAR